MWRWGGIFLVLVGALVNPAVPSAAAQPEAATSEATDETPDGSWLTRTLRRYFGNSAPQGDVLDGHAVELVDRYAEHVGKPIEVVLVYQVARFDSRWHSSKGRSQRVLNQATKPLQAYTKDRTIREFLLFEQGEVVDPFLIADTERLLRSLDFIEDVRITLIPMDVETGSVAVVVETRDRWPFGATGTIKDVGWYEASLFSYSLGGIGLRWENRLLYRQEFRPELGYEGTLRKRNIAGTFVDGLVQYEGSYRKLHKGVALDRTLTHPSLKWVGGVSWRQTRERDRGPNPDEQENTSTWYGKVIQLRDRLSVTDTGRPVLVPAVSFSRRTFLDRPTVSRDTLKSFHNRQNYLVGLTYRRLKYYKTSYLFGMGETEGVPSGLVLKISGGYQDGEFHDRTQGFLQAGYLSVRSRGDIVALRADLGGFYRNRVYEDGSLVLGSTYITRLMGPDRWRSRFYSRMIYHRAINRRFDNNLTLGNQTGVRGMEDFRVEGNQRLLGRFEYRLFTPWSVLGFRAMALTFFDVGIVAGEDDPILQAKVYGSTGVAVRLQNPNLVFPALQISVAFLNSIDDKGISLGIRVEGAPFPRDLVPGMRPGGFVFE